MVTQAKFFLESLRAQCFNLFLFLVFINKTLMYPRIRLYANDVTIYRCIKSFDDVAINALQDLDVATK